MRATLVISGTIKQGMTSLIKKQKNNWFIRKAKNEKDLCIYHHIVGTDSLHRVPGPET
jgi:hypothetical protein